MMWDSDRSALDKEIQIQESLDNEFIVKCYDHFKNKTGNMCAVLDYYPKGDLQKLIKARKANKANKDYFSLE